jgi:hypothetical protein
MSKEQKPSERIIEIAKNTHKTLIRSMMLFLDEQAEKAAKPDYFKVCESCGKSAYRVEPAEECKFGKPVNNCKGCPDCMGVVNAFGEDDKTISDCGCGFGKDCPDVGGPGYATDNPSSVERDDRIPPYIIRENSDEYIIHISKLSKSPKPIEIPSVEEMNEVANESIADNMGYFQDDDGVIDLSVRAIRKFISERNGK